MWLSNSWNNFAPFAGFMLMGYEKRGPLKSAGEETDDSVEDVLANGEKTDAQTN